MTRGLREVVTTRKDPMGRASRRKEADAAFIFKAKGPSEYLSITGS